VESEAIMTVSAVLRGEQPHSAAEARRLLSIHGTRAHAMRQRLEVQGDARKAARLRTELGNVETALGMLEGWASVLAFRAQPAPDLSERDDAETQCP
jgi:hypothetical protein